MKPLRLFRAVFVVSLLAALATPLRAQDPTVVFLVRHAERADDGAMTGEEDPHLSEAGFLRAEVLAHLLADAGITHIHSTDFLRTRETAAPLAERLGLEVEIYNPRGPEALVGELRATPGRHLVVGHSNSTPALVEALGGDPGDPIEHLEYDRLYVVTLGEGWVDTMVLRFGAPYAGEGG